MKDEGNCGCRPSDSSLIPHPSSSRTESSFIPHPSSLPVQVGIALVRRENGYLVRRRPEGTVYAGYWEFPGGKCEPGEAPAAATVRECYEETGLRVRVGPLRRTINYRYAHGAVELFFYDCRTEENIAEPADNTGFRWVSAEELPALQFPEANEAILEELAGRIEKEET